MIRIKDRIFEGVAWVADTIGPRAADRLGLDWLLAKLYYRGWSND